MLRKLPDMFVESSAIVCPSLLPQRRWHRVEEFKSPGWVHDCAVAVCTPAERGGGEMSPGTVFQRECRVEERWNWSDTDQSKQSIGPKTKYIRANYTSVAKTIAPKVPTVKLQLFTKSNPVTARLNGTYHAIVGRARQRSAIVLVLVWRWRVYTSALCIFSRLILLFIKYYYNTFIVIQC